MSLSDAERKLVTQAGQIADPTLRRQAVGVALAKSGKDQTDARSLLAAGFMETMAPSFHLIPKGKAMTPEGAFEEGYRHLALATANFTDVTESTLRSALTAMPVSLAPLRTIIGFTYKELAVAMKLVDPTSTTSGDALKNFERKPRPTKITAVRAAKRDDTVRVIAAAILAVMERRILTVPDSEIAQESFHSKLDKRDTRDGWASVAASAGGVPYEAYLYQRYVGGTWSVVLSAYSEIKGDGVLEIPISRMFEEHDIPFYRTPSGRNGAARTRDKYGLDPGPDFVLPEESPTVIVEAKVAEDDGTARDKASRIKNLAAEARSRGLVTCAVVDGKGWTERLGPLLDVLIATDGRTYSLSTLPYLLEVPEIVSLRQPTS